VIVLGGVGDGVGLTGLFGLTTGVQFMPQKVELVKPEGLDPSMLYITVPPVDFTIVLFLCSEYTAKVYSFAGLLYQ